MKTKCLQTCISSASTPTVSRNSTTTLTTSKFSCPTTHSLSIIMSFLSYRYLIVRIYSVIRHVWELNNVSIVDPVIPSGKDYQDIMYPWISSSLERLWLDKIWVYYNEPLLCHYRFLPQGMRNAALPNFANDLYRRRGCRIWRSTKWQLQTLTTLISIGLSSTSPTVSYLPLVDSVMGTHSFFRCFPILILRLAMLLQVSIDSGQCKRFWFICASSPELCGDWL